MARQRLHDDAGRRYNALPVFSRRFSTRVYYLVGLALFVLGQVGCMLAPSFAALIVFHVLQACGGGLLIPVMMGASLMLVPEEKASTYLAAGTACLIVGPALAPVVSGVLVTTFSWRMCFAVPLAVALAMALAGAFVLRPLAEIDPAASLKTGLFTACCAILIISIMQNFSMSLLLPLQFQSVFGRTAMEAGPLVIPPVLVMTAARASSTAS